MVKMRSKRKQGLTTGEASKILGISRGRVARFFDQKILKGYRNPITRRIVIDLESVKTLKQIWAMTTVTQKEG